MKTASHTPEDLAYAAGFFDGEGHIRIQKHSTRCRSMMLQVSICQATSAPLDWFQETFGGTLKRRLVKYKGNRKVRYDWQASSGVAEKFLRDTLPYLRNKSDEALVALAFRERIGTQSIGAEWNNKRLSEDEVLARETLANKLKQIRAEKHASYMADNHG